MPPSTSGMASRLYPMGLQCSYVTLQTKGNPKNGKWIFDNIQPD